MLVRDGEGDGGESRLEVLMLRRNLKSDFVGGAYVFPGGAVDPADGGREAEAYCTGRSDAEASHLLGIASGGLAYWVAVLRECFEEAGVLLAYPRSALEEETRQVLSLSEPADEARLDEQRQAVNAGRTRFLEVCAAEGLVLALDQVHYFAHWITPEGAPRRYDTRFFVAPAPAHQKPRNDAGETIADEWISPHGALAAHREGRIELIFPTIRNLQAIARFTTSGALLEAAAAAANRVPLVEPRVVADGRGVRIVLPGDPGYESADVAQAPRDPDTFNEAVRAVSREANTPDA
jgi:8-oxo-dGTP pyrophosphatase MutT (NUDIX family)